jgi:tRNA pseudouridine55 synthase
MLRHVHGILLLYKPVGITSNDALQKVKRLFGAEKAGHTGSLDPIATGMLPICLNGARKFSQYLLESDKSYSVTAKLGERTATGDSEGAIIETRPVRDVTEERIEAVLRQFLGEIEQIPPMYSAIKVQGKPLYTLARKGIQIERPPRRITLFSLRLCKVAQGHFTFDVDCSKGTYVRTLVEDIGKALGCGAHVIALRRTAVAPYGNGKMYTFPALQAHIESQGPEGLKTCLLPVETSVQGFPVVSLSTAAAFYLRMGQPVRASFPLHGPLVRLLAEDGAFLGIGEVMPDGRVKPHRLWAGDKK